MMFERLAKVFCLFALTAGCTSLFKIGEERIKIKISDQEFLVLPKYKDLISSKQTRLKIYPNLSHEEARSKISELVKMEEAYFASNIEPYSGKDSIPTSCKLSQLQTPLVGENDRESYRQVNLFASRYFQLGCSSKDPVKAQILHIYCKKNKILYSIFTLLLSSEGWLKDPILNCSN